MITIAGPFRRQDEVRLPLWLRKLVDQSNGSLVICDPDGPLLETW